jgi:hypothetical protein
MNDIIDFEKANTHSSAEAIPRIRNMKCAYNEIVRNDPRSSITYFAFRRDIIMGRIPSRKNGRRYYLNMDEVENYYYRCD